MELFVLSVSLVMASAVSGTEHPSGAIHNRERWIDLDPLYGGGPLRPAPPVSNSWQDPSAEIFVTIPNYRDGACGDTLKALFTQAAHPDRVFVGLVQQRKEDDPDCIERYCTLMGSNLNNCPHMLQIRSMLMSVQEARGKHSP